MPNFSSTFLSLSLQSVQRIWFGYKVPSKYRLEISCWKQGKGCRKSQSIELNIQIIAICDTNRAMVRVFHAFHSLNQRTPDTNHS